MDIDRIVLPIIALLPNLSVKALAGISDDYLVKPFAKEEVIARVNGALRRYRRGNIPSPDLRAADREYQTHVLSGKCFARTPAPPALI